MELGSPQLIHSLPMLLSPRIPIFDKDYHLDQTLISLFWVFLTGLDLGLLGQFDHRPSPLPQDPRNANIYEENPAICDI